MIRVHMDPSPYVARTIDTGTHWQSARCRVWCIVRDMSRNPHTTRATDHSAIEPNVGGRRYGLAGLGCERGAMRWTIRSMGHEATVRRARLARLARLATRASE